MNKTSEVLQFYFGGQPVGPANVSCLLTASLKSLSIWAPSPQKWEKLDGTKQPPLVRTPDFADGIGRTNPSKTRVLDGMGGRWWLLLGGPLWCEESDCQTCQMSLYRTVLNHIVLHHFYDSSVCEHFVLQIRRLTGNWNAGHGGEIQHTFQIQILSEPLPKPQQFAARNTNGAEPHGNSIILRVHRTPAVKTTVS